MKYMTMSERFNVPRFDDPAKIKAGFVTVDPDSCSGCKMCVKICPADALILMDDKATFKEGEDCMACADCVAICPEKAVTLARPYEYSGKFKIIGFGKLALPRF